MHGKVMVFIEATQRGTVMDLRKTFFDFNKASWHDKKSVPAVGVYVEFSADAANRITSVKPSKFQEFKEGDFYTEQDFWQTDSDYELEMVEGKNRTEYVLQLYRTTDFDTLDHIPLSATINQIIDKYFKNEFAAVSRLKEHMDTLEKKPPLIINYFVFKKFITKAYDTLLYMDNSLNQSEFAGIKNITTLLEASYNDMKDKQENINTKRIFDEIFLPIQCYYQALIAAVDNRKNRTKKAQYEIRSARMEVNYEQQKPKPDQEKIAKKQEKMEILNAEIIKLQDDVVRLEKLKDDFYRQNLAHFEENFKATREKLFMRIAAGLDLCATIMDVKIWQMALHSSGARNQYFAKDNNAAAFCTMSFAELYLSRLNRSLLSETDQKLYSYVQNIIKKHRKKFLIVSADSEFIVDLKIKIFEISPYHYVKNAMKDVNFQQLMRDESFDMVYIDENSAWESPADIILKGKRLDRYDKAKFKVV